MRTNNTTTKATTTAALPYGATDRATMLAEAVRRADESSLLASFQQFAEHGGVLEELPVDLNKDVVAYQVDDGCVVADVILAHQDGSASVYMLRNGDLGWRHVCDAIGTLGMCAVQIGRKFGQAAKIKSVLLWSRAGTAWETDAAISAVCERAGVVPVPLPNLRTCLGLLALEQTIAQYTAVRSDVARIMAERQLQEQPA